VHAASISRATGWDLLAVEGNIDVSVTATSSISASATITGAILYVGSRINDITLATLSPVVTEP